MNYADFTPQDFLLDEYFQNWVLQPDPENDLFWKNWLAEHPHQQAAADKARQVLLSLAPKPRQLPAANAARIWNHLQDHIAKTTQLKIKPQEAAQRHRLPRWFQVAAIFLGLLLAGIGFWQLQPPAGGQVVVTSGYGETRKVTLPDNSIVVLNGNSALAYAGDWGQASARKVTLRGEAYFEVRHTRNHQKFEVYFSDAAKVEVLGTRFLVTSRPRKTQVVLQAGKVKVALANQEIAGLAPGAIAQTLMQPGDLVEISQKAQGLLKRKAGDAEAFLAFLQHKLIFKDAPLSEVARVLEDNYGYKITFAEPALAARRFTGSCQHQRIDMLLMAIGKSFNLEIIQHGKTLTVKPK